MTQTYKTIPLDDIVQAALQHGKAPKLNKRKKEKAHGFQLPQTKLSDAQVREIRMRANGRNCAALALEFGVHIKTIRGIADGRFRCKHVL